MSFKVCSFNIRTSAMDAQDGENCWDNRKGVVADIIRKYRPALVGMQEPHKHQVEFLAEQLPEYGWVGSGRCPVVFGLGEEHCEYNPIFYDKGVFEMVDDGQFWLSDMPEIPNTRFDGAAFPRICVWARLKHIESGRDVVFVNTHLDHEGEQPRVRGAQLIVNRIPEKAPDCPVILVGDLNAGNDTECYQVLTQFFQDASKCEGCGCHEGLLPSGSSTFCGFNDDNDSVIDFIFVANGLTATSCGVVPDKQPNGACASDHKPILAELAFA